LNEIGVPPPGGITVKVKFKGNAITSFGNTLKKCKMFIELQEGSSPSE
jgi:hypothetical protein